MGGRILLHSCCGPCAIMPVLRLQDEGLDVAMWFMNPNIQPLTEYFKRRDAALECAQRLNVPILFDDGAWNLEKWLEAQMPRRASPLRCQWCCQSRVERAAEMAAAGGYDFFTTSLLYSRYQPHDAIAEAGRQAAAEGAPEFYYRDFREDWQAGIDKSRAWGIYRQAWCGCIFSEAERYSKKLGRLMAEPERQAR